MKKIIAGVAALLVATTIFAQEDKPVIGLMDLVVSQSSTLATGTWGEIWREAVTDAKTGAIVTPKKMIAPAASPVEVRQIVPPLEAAFSHEIVSSGRFSVFEMKGAQTADGIDFLFQPELTEFSANRDQNGHATYKMSVLVKFTNVKTGQLVISEQFEVPIAKKSSSKGGFFQVTKTTSISDPMTMPGIMAKHVIETIVTKLYPPMVLSVNGSVIQIPATGMEVGTVVEVVEQGEEIIDPYTGGFMGYEETLVAEIVVYEVKGRMANASPDPKGKYVDAQIQKGMAIHATTRKNNKAARALNKAKK